MHLNVRTRTRNILLSASAIALLAACDPLVPGGSAETAPPEVQAASVFQKTDAALWDGRPSLGGAWIAHADATTPERVEIRNNKTGKTLTAALFRRERDFPGPSFQLSADAAAALGIPAGIPTEVTVTALRRVEVPKPAPTAAPAPAAATTPPKAAAAGDAALVASAGAAIDEALGEGEAVVAEPAERPGSFFGSKPKNTGVNAPAAETAPVPAKPAPAAAAATPEPEPRAGSAGSTPGNKPTMVDDQGEPIAEAPASTPITTTKITPPPSVPATTPPVAPVTTPAAEAEAAPAAPETSLEQATITDLERPFVQVASGSTESNVLELVAKLKTAGLTAQIRQTTQAGKVLWYAVVGPAASQAELDANLAKVRELGYSEAFITKG